MITFKREFWKGINSSDDAKEWVTNNLKDKTMLSAYETKTDFILDMLNQVSYEYKKTKFIEQNFTTETNKQLQSSKMESLKLDVAKLNRQKVLEDFKMLAMLKHELENKLTYVILNKLDLEWSNIKRGENYNYIIKIIKKLLDV